MTQKLLELTIHANTAEELNEGLAQLLAFIKEELPKNPTKTPAKPKLPLKEEALGAVSADKIINTEDNSAEKQIDISLIREATSAAVKNEKRKEAKEIFASYDAKGVKDLEEDKYAEVYAKLTKLL